MKVKYIGKTSAMGLEKDKIYEPIAIEGEEYRIIDLSGEDYLYHKSEFEIIEE